MAGRTSQPRAIRQMEELVGDQRVGVRGQSACLVVPAIRLGLINGPECPPN